MELTLIRQQAYEAAIEIIGKAKLLPKDILVVGCSTSEVIGANIGTAGSKEVATSLLSGLRQACFDKEVFLAIQCCEHLNRALVVEKSCCEKYSLDQVSVKPVATAGGALASMAMEYYEKPVVVETIVAHAGIDIGVGDIARGGAHVTVLAGGHASIRPVAGKLRGIDPWRGGVVTVQPLAVSALDWGHEVR